MNWFELSLLSIIVLAGADLTQQHLLNHEKVFNERTTSVLVGFTQALLAFLFICLTGRTNELFNVLSPSSLGLLLLVSITSYCGMVFYFKSFKVKNISFSGIMVSLSVVVSTTLGVIIFKESTSFLKFLGICLILSSIISVNINNSKLEKNHLFGLLAGILFGISYTLDKTNIGSIEPLIYMFWTFLIMSMIGIVVTFKEIKTVLIKAKFIDVKPVVFSAFGYGLYNYFTFNAYKIGGEVGKIDAINNSSIFLVIIFEYFILKDKSNIQRKILASIVSITGIFILGNTI